MRFTDSQAKIKQKPKEMLNAADSHYLLFCILLSGKRMNPHHSKDGRTKPASSGKRPGEHVWTSGADVQSVWKKYGWTPPSKKTVDTAVRDRPAANHALRVLRG